MTNGTSTVEETPAPTAGQPRHGRSDNSLWILRALRKHWPLVVAAALLCTGASLLYTKTQTKIYEAEALLEFDPDVIKPLGNKADPLIGWSAIWDTQQYYETQYKIITSERVLSAVVRDLGLQSDADYLGFVPKEPAPLSDTVESLRGRVKVEPVKGSRLVLIKVEDPRPPMARRLADAVARAYIAQNLEKMVSATGDTVVWLSGQLDHFKTELEQNENALHDFKRKNDLPSSTLDDLSKMARMEMQDFDSALTRTRMRRQELQARHSELAKIAADNPDEVPASELLSNSFLGSLRQGYQQAIRERRELVAEGKGENHPQVKRSDEKVTLSRKALLDEVRNIQGAIARDLAIIERQENGEASLYEGSRKKAVDLNLKELEFHRLDRLRAQNEKLYGVLLEQLKEADLRRMMNTNNIRLVDPALEPKAPIRPRTSMNLAVGLGLGLLMGLGIVAAKEQLDSSLKTPDDVEEYLRVPFLGLLPEYEEETGTDGKRKRTVRRRPAVRGSGDLPPELAVHAFPRSGLAEASRAVRTNLMFMNPDRPYRKLLVTSSAPSEGKTTVACSVAISLAQSGHRVCIIDCDLRRPRLHRIFGRSGDEGVTSVLVGTARIEDVAKPTVVPNLYSIPCGPIPPNPADILQSETFKRFLDDLGTRFDRLVIDSPPVVAVTDAAILSTLVEGVLFVVRAFKTARSVARTGLRTLEDVDAPVAGTVLNAVDLDRHEYSYYHYYYYKRYDAYGGGNAPATPPPSSEPPRPTAPN